MPGLLTLGALDQRIGDVGGRAQTLLYLGYAHSDRNQLEQLCIQCAQRISMLHEFDAPEFSDRTLFKQFIESLQEIEVLERSGRFK